MPQTIESKVENFRKARERRAAGKPSWDRSVDIRSAITGGTTAPEIASVAHEVARRLRAGLPASFFDISHPDYNFDFVEAVEDLEAMTAAELERSSRDEQLEDLNGRLDEIYDFADRERIWLGA